MGLDAVPDKFSDAAENPSPGSRPYAAFPDVLESSLPKKEKAGAQLCSVPGECPRLAQSGAQEDCRVCKLLRRVLFSVPTEP